jgi:hypothetical protein
MSAQELERANWQLENPPLGERRRLQAHGVIRRRHARPAPRHQGAARIFQGGAVTQVVVEMQEGLLIEMAISGASTLAVLAAADCDLGLVAYEMTLLADKVRGTLTPATR